MRSRLFLLCLLTISVAYAQTSKPVQGPTPSVPAAEKTPAQTAPAAPSPTPAATTPDPAAVPDSAPVVTIDGVCNPETSSEKAPAGPCRTEITKAQFEKLMSAIAPPGTTTVPATMKRQSAEKFAELLTVAAAAEKSGVENNPQTQELLKIARLQTLASSYARQLQQTSKPSDAEIEAYYKANEEKYQQATVKQVFVPPLKTDAKPATAAKKDAAGKPEPPSPMNKEATEKERAEKLRQRAIAGEPFDKLEKEAVEGSSYQTPLPVDVTLQRQSVPPQRQFIFNLKEGEISPVMNEPSGAVFFKLISKSTVPLAQVKESISQQLAQEKFRSTLEALRSSGKPVLNEAYFGPATPAGMPAAMPAGAGMMPRRMPPTSPQPKPAPAPQSKPAPTTQPK